MVKGRKIKMTNYIKSSANTVLSARSGKENQPSVLFVQDKEDAMSFSHLYEVHDFVKKNKELFATAIENGQVFTVCDLNTDKEIMEADFIEKIVKK